ncbi:MAG: hypothetical protein ACLRZQ_02700 [Akkermansia muciniphila]
MDGSNPRDGLLYEGPLEVGAGEVRIEAFAEHEGLETRESFTLPAERKGGGQRSHGRFEPGRSGAPGCRRGV